MGHCEFGLGEATERNKRQFVNLVIMSGFDDKDCMDGFVGEVGEAGVMLMLSSEDGASPAILRSVIYGC